MGGFRVSSKMLDLFKRPGEAKDFFEYYYTPLAVLIGGTVIGAATGLTPQMPSVVSIGAAIACISSISSLAEQKSARFGNLLGIFGVAVAITTAIAQMWVDNPDVETLKVILGFYETIFLNLFHCFTVFCDGDIVGYWWWLTRT